MADARIQRAIKRQQDKHYAEYRKGSSEHSRPWGECKDFLCERAVQMEKRQ